MASVDAKKSYLATSDEILQHVCRPCDDDGERKEARYFCEFCKDYICFDCRNDHRTFKATKNHSVVAVQVTKRVGSMTTKGTFAILCGCDHTRAVEVYCEEHDEVICTTCKTIKHRNCKTDPIKDKVTRNTKKNFEEFMNKARSLKSGAENCKKDGEGNYKEFQDSKQERKKEILAYRHKLNTLLDKMETNSMEDLDQTADQQLVEIKNNIATLTTTQQELNADLAIMDNAYKTNDEEVMFSAIIKLSKNMSAYDDIIHDTRKGSQLPKLEFHKHENLLNALKGSEDLGRIETSETYPVPPTSVKIVDMKIKSTKEVNIKLEDDVYNPNILGCAFLSNNRILLCDCKNRRLKLLDSGMSVKQSLKLPFHSGPYNVASISANEAIITFGNISCNDMQYIYTQPDLKLGKKITLPVQCYGLSILNDEIYTAYHKESGHDEIWRLDRAGNILSKIVFTRNSSGRPDHLGLCLESSNPRVYLTDWRDSKVTCLQQNGKAIYQYQDQGLKWPLGIYVDKVGNSLVCGSDSNNVVVITADGRKYGELLTSKDVVNPCCIDYRPKDQTLIVGCYDSSKLFVYMLGV